MLVEKNASVELGLMDASFQSVVRTCLFLHQDAWKTLSLRANLEICSSQPADPLDCSLMLKTFNQAEFSSLISHGKLSVSAMASVPTRV